MAYISVDVDIDIEDYLDEVKTKDLEKELAKRTSYGDLGKTLRKKDYNGTSITIPVNGVPYEMTWNKVAKAIHRWVKESTENG